MGCGRGTWFRLNIPVIVFCIGWCTLFIALSTECLKEHLDSLEEGERIVDVRKVYNQVLRYPVVITASAAVMCYIAVSWRVPRPPILHWNGFVLLLIVFQTYEFINIACIPTSNETYSEVQWHVIVIKYLSGIKRSILIPIMTIKIDVLGPPLSCVFNIRRWGWILGLSQATHTFFLDALVTFWSLSMWDRGYTRREIVGSRLNVVLEEQREVSLEPIDEFVVPFSVYGVICGAVWVALMRFLYILIATRLIWHTMKKLMDRKADSAQLRKVRIVLWQHCAGIVLVLCTGTGSSMASIWQTMALHNALGWEEPMTPAPSSLSFLIDSTGDIVGILLLSGIGTLLFKETPDGGDISAHIRGILHSAVLTSRGESVFEGRVMSTPSNVCMVSFPGKYWAEWNELTWFCERGELSSACVFLPQNDPHQRFGRHEMNPNTPGMCWCHSMYGGQKPWGCAWFSAWMANVEMAVSLNLELVVIYFPSQINQGTVEWENLKNYNLWDGVGLGGSQKVEVAWLTMKGYRFTSEDLTATKQRFDRARLGPTTTTSGSSLNGTPSTTIGTPASASKLWSWVRTPASSSG